MSTTADQLSCQELVELVTAYLEHALSPQDHAHFEQHLHLCEDCRNYLGQMQVTIATLGTLPPESLPPTMRDRLLEAFRDWKRT